MDADEFSRYAERKKHQPSTGAKVETTKPKHPNQEKLLKQAISEMNLPVSMLEITYARSSGPGGQNVNKVNSKAILRMNVGDMDSFGKGTAERFRLIYSNCVTKEDQVIVSSQESRDQEQNREIAMKKLKSMICEARLAPKEQLIDFYEESEEMKKKRIDEKRKRSEYKRNSKDGGW